MTIRPVIPAVYFHRIDDLRADFADAERVRHQAAVLLRYAEQGRDPALDRDKEIPERRAQLREARAESLKARASLANAERALWDRPSVSERQAS